MTRRVLMANSSFEYFATLVTTDTTETMTPAVKPRAEH